MNAALLALLLSGAVAAQPASLGQLGSTIPQGMKKCFIAFLVKGEKADRTIQKAELDQLRRSHLEYIQAQAKAGKYALAGPFLDNDRIRGIAIVDAASADEARAIASGDPMVGRGVMAVEVHPFIVADLSCVLTEYYKAGGK